MESIKEPNNDKVSLTDVVIVFKHLIGYKFKKWVTKITTLTSVSNHNPIMIQSNNNTIIIYKNHIFDARNDTTKEATNRQVFQYLPRIINPYKQNITYYAFWKGTSEDESSSDSSSNEETSDSDSSSQNSKKHQIYHLMITRR